MNEQTAKQLYDVFQAQGVTLLYASRCCGRLYVGLRPAVKCRTCEKSPKNEEIRSKADLDNL